MIQKALKIKLFGGNGLKFKFIDWIGEWLFGIVVLLYAAILPIGAKFGVIDDYLFLNTILSGRRLDFFIVPAVGRFFPLTGQEYNIVSFFSSLPSIFYVYNMFQFVVVIYLIYKILAVYVIDKINRKSITFGIILLMIFSPGFVTAWFRLFVGERSMLMFFLIFFLLYLLYQKKQKYVYLACGLLAANLALYYKEPSFLMLGGFTFFHLLSGWKSLNIKQRLFDVLLIVSAITFSLVYFFVIFTKKGIVNYGDTPYNPIITFIKNMFSYMLSDPFLIVLLLGLFLYRFYEIISRKKKLEPLYDATIFSGVAYVLFFLKFKVFNYHYLLPAYVFSIFGLVHFLIRKEYIKKKVCKCLFGVAIVIYIFSALPVSLHLISYYKNVPNTFQDTLGFLTKYINKEEKRVTIYLDGVDRGGGKEIYVSFANYFNYKGLRDIQFDFKSDISSRNSVIFLEGNPESPFTVFHDSGTSQCEAGDLLVLTPYTSKFVDQRYLNELKNNYELIYHSKAAFSIPNISIKSLLKYCLMQCNQGQFSDDVMFSNNIFNWPDFYVFRKRVISSGV